MKFFNLLLFALCFCGCATVTPMQSPVNAPGKTVPVFMTGGQQRAALKTVLEIKGKTYNFLLLANKKDDYINFKLIGDFASILASVNLHGNSFEYEAISPLFEGPQAKQFLEEVLLALFAPNTLSGNKYYFKKGENLPYKLKQKGQTTKTFLFENYDGRVPQNITVKTKFNLLEIKLKLLTYE